MIKDFYGAKEAIKPHLCCDFATSGVKCKKYRHGLRETAACLRIER
jgi:hypothetical protein